MEGIEILENGGRQSHLKRRYDLIEFETLDMLIGIGDGDFFLDSDVERAVYQLHRAASKIIDGDKYDACWSLRVALSYIADTLEPGIDMPSAMNLKVSTLSTLAEVFYEGSLKYPVRNYLLIPIESHINHALNHLYSYLQGDTSEPHVKHALCRVFMALTVYYKSQK